MYGRWAADAYASAWRHELDCKMPSWSSAVGPVREQARPDTFAECLGGSERTLASFLLSRRFGRGTDSAHLSIPIQDFLFWYAGILLIDVSYAWVDDVRVTPEPDGGVNQLRRWTTRVLPIAMQHRYRQFGLGRSDTQDAPRTYTRCVSFL